MTFTSPDEDQEDQISVDGQDGMCTGTGGGRPMLPSRTVQRQEEGDGRQQCKARRRSLPVVDSMKAMLFQRDQVGDAAMNVIMR